ncbi:hypothetical protein V5O48_013927 [Marasmius crinis-equi]|uniref:Uncharacterized protein n=1 Tax=Marasmius crinis-equi TaxID=585013 RepID=A0ABR3EZ31_9AGAR
MSGYDTPARSRSSSPTKPKNTQGRIEKALAKRRDAVLFAEDHLVEQEKERREASNHLRGVKAMYKDAVERKNHAKANVRVSNEELAQRLADMQEITDKVRGLLAADALDEFTDSASSTSGSTQSSPSSRAATTQPPRRGSPSQWSSGSGFRGVPAGKTSTRPGDADSSAVVEGEEDQLGDELGDLSIQGPEIPQISVEAGSRFPAYVVYYGKNGQHGLFTGWKSTQRKSGASSLLEEHGHVVKGFTDPALASDFYREFSQSDAANVLSYQPCDNERFVVIKGVKPGVYDTRKSLIIDGIQYRGAVVRRFVGGRGDALAKFNEWKKQGHVKVTHPARDLKDF